VAQAGLNLHPPTEVLANSARRLSDGSIVVNPALVAASQLRKD
jgi:hypothetical protein